MTGSKQSIAYRRAGGADIAQKKGVIRAGARGAMPTRLPPTRWPGSGTAPKTKAHIPKIIGFPAKKRPGLDVRNASTIAINASTVYSKAMGANTAQKENAIRAAAAGATTTPLPPTQWPCSGIQSKTTPTHLLIFGPAATRRLGSDVPTATKIGSRSLPTCKPVKGAVPVATKQNVCYTSTSGSGPTTRNNASATTGSTGAARRQPRDICRLT